jgi:hypothetical protein
MTKISDKLIKVNESFTVNMYDNGYMFEIAGRDEEEDYKTAKILCTSAEHLNALIQEAISLPRDE